MHSRTYTHTDSNLSAWADDGVLLLNTALTVRAATPGSHSKKGWEEFTDKVIEIVDKYGGSSLPSEGPAKTGLGRGIVFMAWGAWAAKRVANLDKVSVTVLYCCAARLMATAP
jgi:uracil-DNA glycosylase